jgi:hypothetical protein
LFDHVLVKLQHDAMTLTRGKKWIVAHGFVVMGRSPGSRIQCLKASSFLHRRDACEFVHQGSAVVAMTPTDLHSLTIAGLHLKIEGPLSDKVAVDRFLNHGNELLALHECQQLQRLMLFVAQGDGEPRHQVNRENKTLTA